MAKTKKKTKGWYSHPTKGWIWYDPKTPKETYHPIAGPTGEAAKGAYALTLQGPVRGAKNLYHIGRGALNIVKKGAVAYTEAKLAETESYRALGDSISRGVQEEIGDRLTRDWETGLSVKQQKEIDRENRRKRRSLNIGGN